MTKKNIWIVNFHTAPQKFALNHRYAKMVPFLQQAGYQVTVISTAFLRRHQLDLSNGKTYNPVTYGGIPFIHIKSNRYKGNGLGRMISLFIFSLRLLFISKKFGKPDIIYHNLHVPFDLLVLFAAKRFKASYIAEVWDLWPEFFYRTGLINKNNLLLKVAYRLEKWVYTRAERIVFTMEGGIDYIHEKGWDTSSGGTVNVSKVHYINNGIDLEQFEIDSKENIMFDKDLEDEVFRIVYVGSMQKANDVGQLIKAAEILKDQNDIRFLLYGDGSEREKLIDYCTNQELYNVHFKAKYLPFNQLPFILSKSSLNVLNYQKNFGDYGISSGKLFLYLAAGKPILSNVAVKYCVITKYNLGISKDIFDAGEYVKYILQIKNLNMQDYSDMCKRVDEVAKQFDYSKLAELLLITLDSINKE